MRYDDRLSPLIEKWGPSPLREKQGVARAIKSLQIMGRQIEKVAYLLGQLHDLLVVYMMEWAERTGKSLGKNSSELKEVGRFYRRIVSRVNNNQFLDRPYLPGKVYPELNFDWKPARKSRISVSFFLIHVEDELEGRNTTVLARFRDPLPEELPLSETDLVELWKKHGKKRELPWCGKYVFGQTRKSVELEDRALFVVGKNSPEYLCVGDHWYGIQANRAELLGRSRSSISGLVKLVPGLRRYYSPPRFWDGKESSLSGKELLRELERELGPGKPGSERHYVSQEYFSRGTTGMFRLPIIQFVNVLDDRRALIVRSEDSREVLMLKISLPKDPHDRPEIDLPGPDRMHTYVAEEPGSDLLSLVGPGEDSGVLLDRALGLEPGEEAREEFLESHRWRTGREAPGPLSEKIRGFRTDLALRDAREIEVEIRKEAGHALTHLETIRRTGIEEHPDGEKLHEFLSRELFDRRKGLPALMSLMQEFLDDIAATQRRGRR